MVRMRKIAKNFIHIYIANIKKNCHYFLCCAFIFFLTLGTIDSWAYKPVKGKISAATGPFFLLSDSFKGIDNFYEKPEPGWSLIAEAVLGETSGLEIGLFYFTKRYLRTLDDKYLIQKGKRVYITTGYRYWFSSYFSTSLNLYSSYTIGDTKDIYRSNGLPSDFKTSAEKITNYGLDASLRYEYSFDQVHGLAFDTRYSYSVTAKDNEDSNTISIGIYYMREVPVK